MYHIIESCSRGYVIKEFVLSLTSTTWFLSKISTPYQLNKQTQISRKEHIPVQCTSLRLSSQGIPEVTTWIFNITENSKLYFVSGMTNPSYQVQSIIFLYLQFVYSPPPTTWKLKPIICSPGPNIRPPPTAYDWHMQQSDAAHSCLNLIWFLPVSVQSCCPPAHNRQTLQGAVTQ